MKNRIKEIRKHAKLTQDEFGKRLGISKSAVQSIEYGNNGASEGTIRTICSEFHVSRTWLETGEGPMLLEAETADELIDEKLENGSEFAKALLRVIARMPDDDLLAVERMFVALREELDTKKDQGE